MNKYAFFVEGQTERIFLEKFIAEYFTFPAAVSESKKIVGDNIVSIRINSHSKNTGLYFLIYDVGNDERVATQMIEKVRNMVETQNYKMIFGLRDLYPNPRNKKSEIVKQINNEFEKTGFMNNLKIVIAVMEIESWFLSDCDVFSKINNVLTTDNIFAQLELNLQDSNPEDFDKPSNIIDKILRLIGDRYEKTESDSYKIISRLDFCKLCLDENVLTKVHSLKYLLDSLNLAIN